MQNDQQNGQFYNPDPQQQTGATEAQQSPQPIQAPENISQQSQQHTSLDSRQFDDEDSIRWTASEFVQHDKKAGWYLILALVTLSVAALAYLMLGKDLFAPSIVLILGVVFGIAGSRKPRILDYSISDDGLSVGQKHFNYEDFKSFSLISEGQVSTVLLMPSKRFSPSLTLYVPEEETDDVLNALGLFLPLEQHEVGYVDKFLGKIRF